MCFSDNPIFLMFRPWCRSVDDGFAGFYCNYLLFNVKITYFQGYFYLTLLVRKSKFTCLSTPRVRGNTTIHCISCNTRAVNICMCSSELRRYERRLLLELGSLAIDANISSKSSLRCFSYLVKIWNRKVVHFIIYCKTGKQLTHLII